MESIRFRISPVKIVLKRWNFVLSIERFHFFRFVIGLIDGKSSFMHSTKPNETKPNQIIDLWQHFLHFFFVPLPEYWHCIFDWEYGNLLLVFIPQYLLFACICHILTSFWLVPFNSIVENDMERERKRVSDMFCVYANNIFYMQFQSSAGKT